MSKYLVLRDHLLSLQLDRWVASFEDIERVLNFRLPQSARKYPAWWANESTLNHSQCAGWLEAGWRTAEVDLKGQQVTFIRFQSGRKEAPEFKPARARLEWADVLDVPIDSSQLKLTLGWQRLGSLVLDTKEMLAFPRTPIGPAIYRLRLTSEDEASTYFGETDEVSRRFQHFRTPGPTQKTNQWLNERMMECLRKGGSVEVDVLQTGTLKFTDSAEAPNISCKFTRRLLENAAIVIEIRSGRTVLNR